MTPCGGVLTCPVCDAPLNDTGRSFRCPRNHTFDRAKEGYVHLLPAGHGRSKIQGDTREMVRARRRFLERGHFAPVSRAINDIAVPHLEAAGATVSGRGAEGRGGQKRGGPVRGEPARGTADRAPSGEGVKPAPVPTAVEVGCGEGYYIGGLARAAAPAPDGRAPCFIGLDVSKEAVRLAARAYREVLFLVNDVRHRISVADAAVDVLLDVFAPRNPDEFARVLRPDGLLIVAIPGDDHLGELRARLPLLGIEPDKRERTVEQLAGGFDLVAEEALAYERDLSPEEVDELLRMTPNYWHLDEATLAEVAGWGSTAVTVAVRILGFRKPAT